jgi:hypothetical protein
MKTVAAAESHLSTTHRSDNWVSMKPRHAAALALVGQSCLIFGVASLLLSMVGLFLAFAYGNDSVWALVVIYVAFWPNLLLSLFLPNVWYALFFAPIGFIFGIPLVGWALLGIPAGLWRAKRLGSVI